MIRLIINADDYGMNPNCTKAITECMLKGWVTNTSLMVNMPSCEDAVEQARQNGLLDRIGLHLNFTEGVPLTERIRENREFCDENGEFNWGFRSGGFKKLLRSLDAADADVLAEETEAQIRRYIDLGLPVRHFDAHHHSHLVYRVIPVVFGVARKYGFKSVRRPVNVAVRKKLRSRIYYPINAWWKTAKMRPYGFAFTDYMGALADFRALYDTLKNSATFDLMVHPMYLKNGGLDMSGEMSDSGLRPMKETSDFVDSHVEKGEIIKISYKEIQSL